MQAFLTVMSGSVACLGSRAGVTSTDKNQGVAGFTSDALGVGVYGVNFERHAHGILGAHDGSSERKPVGVFGANWDRTGYAGFFAGNVAVTGELLKSASLLQNQTILLIHLINIYPPLFSRVPRYEKYVRWDGYS